MTVAGWGLVVGMVDAHCLTDIDPAQGILNQGIGDETRNENAAGFRKPTAFSFAVLCIIVFKLFSAFWGRRSLQIRYAIHF